MRTWLFGLCLLFVSASGLGQSTATESQACKRVAEVRQLRMDLQTSNGYALRAPVLLQRLQVQETAVARASGRLSDARGTIADIQRRRVKVTRTLKRFEPLKTKEYVEKARLKYPERKTIGIGVIRTKG